MKEVLNEKQSFITGMLPLIGEITFWGFLVLMYRWLAPTAYIQFFMHVEGFSVVVGSVIFILLITGLMQSFFKSFRYAFFRIDMVDEKQYRKCRLSIMTAIVTAILAGLLSTVTSTIDVLSRTVTDGNIHIENMWFFISIACTGFLYGLIISIFLLPLYIRLKVKTL